MAKGTIPTQQEIERLYKAAENGSDEAREELGKINNRLAKRANERMRDIERKGLEGTQAYKRAKYFIGEQDFGTADRNYFSQSKKLDNEDLLTNIQNVSIYLRSQTSTAAGEIRRRTGIIDTLADRGYLDIPEDKPEEFKKKFLDFLDSKAWDDIKKHMYATGSGLIKEAGEAIQNGANVNDLLRAFKDYQKGADTDLFEIWDNWLEGDSFYRGGEWHKLKRPRT